MSRIDRLQLLLERFADGEQTKLAQLIGKSRSQVNHWFTGVRPVGETVARHIEIALNLPRGWLDDDADLPDSATSHKSHTGLDRTSLEQTLARLGEFLEQLEPEKHEGFIAILKLMMTNPKNELYPTMLAQLFPQSDPLVSTIAYAGKPKTEVENLVKPAFVK